VVIFGGPPPRTTIQNYSLLFTTEDYYSST